MSLLQRLTPINLLEEKAKFLADPTYNPKFVFTDPVDRETLQKYGLPQPKYIELAKEILDRAYFGRNEQDLLMMEGPILSEQEVTAKTEMFLKLHHLEKRFKVVWSTSFISRTTINEDTIKFRSPSIFRKHEFIGMLYHEIGTHALRRINYEQQPWYRRKKSYGFTDYLRTEEGLACLHSLIPSSMKLTYDMASRYVAVEYAQSHSFSQLWHFLGRYIQDEDTRWMVTLRQKRGLTDTAQPGGFTKDLVYFEGVVDIWKWLKQHDFDPTLLYYGKLAWQDVEKAREMNPEYEPALPSFFIVDINKYKESINTIGEINLFGKVK